MGLLPAILLGLAMGIVFGFALEKSRVFEPGVILGQMRLESFTMLRMFFAAVATGLVVLAVLNGLGLAPLHPKAMLFAADILGGVLLGVGIAIAGACPGTVAAQIGAGYRDAWLTFAGGLLGALAYGLADPVVAPFLAAGGLGKLTLNAALGLPFWPVALVFAALFAAACVGLERWRPWRDELGIDGDAVRGTTRRLRPAPAE